MNPECLLITTPSVDFSAFTGLCQQVLGYSPVLAADVLLREPSEAERFLSCLAALRDRKPPGLPHTS